MTAEYRTWVGIKARCYDENDPSYPRYGGRGIVVDSRWLETFEYFLADMGSRPGSGYSIERIDNDGPYALQNCRWATAREQARNRSNNVSVTAQGRTATIAEWADMTGLNRATIEGRIARGWRPEDIVVARTLGFGDRTHCSNGHEFTPDNTRIRTGGSRICRACGREASRRYYQRLEEGGRGR